MQSKKKLLSLWLVLFVIFLDWMGIGLVYPLFSSMLFHPGGPVLAAGASDSARSLYLGILLAAMPFSLFFSSPILGALSDQKGRRPIFLMSLAISVGAYLICALGVWIQSLLLLFIGRLVTGVAAGNAAVVTATVADLSSAETKGKNFGLYSMSCGLGFMVGPFLGGWFSATSFVLPFMLSAGTLLLNFLLIYFLFTETHVRDAQIHIRLHAGIVHLKRAFQMKELRVLFAAFCLFCFGWSFFYEFIPVAWIADWGFSSSQIGTAYAYGAGFYALSAGCLIRPFLSRYKHSTLLVTSLAVLGLMLFGILAPLPAYSIWIYLPLFNFCVAMIWPTATTMVSDYAPQNAQGETLGVYQSVQGVAFALSPLFAGWVLSFGPHMTGLVAAVAMLLAALILSRK